MTDQTTPAADNGLAEAAELDAMTPEEQYTAARAAYLQAKIVADFLSQESSRAITDASVSVETHAYLCTLFGCAERQRNAAYDSMSSLRHARRTDR